MTTELWLFGILAFMLSVVIAQNMGLNDKLKEIEEKLDRLES